MTSSFQRKVLAYGFVAGLATCVAAGVPDVNAGAVQLDLTDDPAIRTTLKEFQEAKDRNPDYLLETCPSACTDFQSTPEWFLYSDAARLARCNETMLLDLPISHDLKSKDDPIGIRACKANYEASRKVAQSLDTASVCTTSNHLQVHIPIKLSSKGSAGLPIAGALAAAHQIESYVSAQSIMCDNNTISFGYSDGSIIGLYSGKEIHQQGITAQVLSQFQDYLQKGDVPEAVVAQLCNSDGRGADYAIGIAASLSGDLAFVQNAVKSWNNGECVTGVKDVSILARLRFNVPDIHSASNGTRNGTDPWSISTQTNVFRPRLTARADCRTTKVQAGDGCYTVAQRCGISQSDLTKYNTRSNFCGTLAAGETVCCSSGTLAVTTLPPKADGTCQTRTIVAGDECSSLAAKCGITTAEFTQFNPDPKLCSSLAVGGFVCCGRGTRPDNRPKQNSDGSCFVYQTKTDDGCYSIAAAHGLTLEEIEELNQDTWGWNGCDQPLYVGVYICLSTGTPPMPAPVANAVCGPTVPGTLTPPSGTNISTLNPCKISRDTLCFLMLIWIGPLKVCCNVWGQCGTTTDFCTIAKSATGAPGTSAPGKNSCIDNCGTDIIKSSPPKENIKIAYFESWNWDRACLYKHVDSIDKSVYSHIHFAFADITPDFKVDVSRAQNEFDRFKAMTGIKKIISFGGWAFSTEPDTFNILREATKPANRIRFTTNLLKFVSENGLDGIDLDWEYPGAPDIFGIPAGDPDAGMNYYNTLVQLKTRIPSGKTVSFAAPASYWYLKAFPIEAMGKALDYIVYMTYDLHGQWDYGSQWSSPGCPTGNCLRSHVNLTETLNSLSMITKAGVPSNKVVVGVASYGRSFKMAQAGCHGPLCLFTGSAGKSNALPGICTNEAGYIANAEIYKIIEEENLGVMYDKESDSEILIYGDDETEWVAYMGDSIKSKREKLYATYNMAGTSDWAVDLQAFDMPDEMDGIKPEPEDHGPAPEWEDCENDTGDFVEFDCPNKYYTLDDLDRDARKIPETCRDKYLVDVEIATLTTALDSYDKLVKGRYDSKFKTYEKSVKAQVPDIIYKYMGGAQKTGFFQCTQINRVSCCRSRDCKNIWQCEKCNWDADCVDGPVRVTVDCPTILSSPVKREARWNEDVPEVTYHLLDHYGFHEDIAKHGIDESWLSWGDRTVRRSTSDQEYDIHWHNFPRPGDIKIPNPKGIIGGNYTAMRNLVTRMRSEADEAFDAGDVASMSDIADSGSIPALTLQSAVDSMNEIVDIAEKIEEQERKSFILNFITSFLMLVPIVGQVAGSVGGSLLRTIINLAGELGQLAVGIYEVVDDPSNILLNVFGMVLGAELRPFKEIAAARRGMKDTDLDKLGTIKLGLKTIASIKGKGADVCKL